MPPSSRNLPSSASAPRSVEAAPPISRSRSPAKASYPTPWRPESTLNLPGSSPRSPSSPNNAAIPLHPTSLMPLANPVPVAVLKIHTGPWGSAEPWQRHILSGRTLLETCRRRPSRRRCPVPRLVQSDYRRPPRPLLRNPKSRIPHPLASRLIHLSRRSPDPRALCLRRRSSRRRAASRRN